MLWGASRVAGGVALVAGLLLVLAMASTHTNSVDLLASSAVVDAREQLSRAVAGYASPPPHASPRFPARCCGGVEGLLVAWRLVVPTLFLFARDTRSLPASGCSRGPSVWRRLLPGAPLGRRR